MNQEAFFTRRWTKIIGIIAAFAFIISVILPWYSCNLSSSYGGYSFNISPAADYIVSGSILNPTDSQNFDKQFQWTGNPVPAILIVVIGLVVLACAHNNLNASSLKSSVTGGIVGIIFSVAGIILTIVIINSLNGQELSYSSGGFLGLPVPASLFIGRSFGFYAALIGSIVAAVTFAIDLIFDFIISRKSASRQSTLAGAPATNSIYPTPTKGPYHDSTQQSPASPEQPTSGN